MEVLVINKTPYGTYGQLDHDPDLDRLLCHDCGRWYVNLAQHARLAHHLDADAYRERAGLNRQTHLVAPRRRAQLREQALPLIERLRAEGKLKRWNEDPEKWARDKAAAVRALSDGLRAEGSRNRSAGIDREAARERRRARNLAGLDRASGEAIRAGIKRQAGQGECARCGEPYQRTGTRQRYCSPCRPEVAREASRESAARRRQRVRDGEETAPRRADPLRNVQPRTAVCPHCGQSFQAASHRDRYCIPCRPLVARACQREYARKRRQRRAAEEVPL